MIADAALRTSLYGYPYVSRRWSAQTLGAEKTDANGHPVVESAAQEREIMARTGLVRD